MPTVIQQLLDFKDGGTLKLAAGHYPQETITFTPTSELVVDAGDATFDALWFAGCGQQTWRFNPRAPMGTIRCFSAATRAAKPTHDMTFDGPTIRGGSFECRDGANRVKLQNFDIGYTGSGILGPGRVDRSYDSYNLTFRNGAIHHVTADAAQFGFWNHVLWEGVNVYDVHSNPSNRVHNDGWQIVGAVSDCTWQRCTATRSDTQLLFCQDQLGPVEDIKVFDCAFGSCGGVAVQMIGVDGLSMDRVLVWQVPGQDGGVWLRKGAHGHMPSHAALSDVLTSDLRVMDGVPATVV